MSEETELNSFVEMFHGEIMDRCSCETVDDTTTPDFKENVFTTVFVEYLEELGALEESVTCHYIKSTGKGNIKTNGFSYNEDRGELSLFISIFKGARITTVAPSEVEKVAKQAARFHQVAIKGAGLQADMEPSSDQYGLVQRIHQIRDDIKTVKVFIFMDGITKIKKMKGFDRNGTRYLFDIWDIQRLFRVISSNLPYEVMEINFMERFKETLPCIHTSDSKGIYDAYMVVIPAGILYNLYDEYGSSLLELNVRSFLQARSKVNKGIRDTLRNEPDRFLAYNNGISITAVSVELADDGTSAIKSLKGLQIVNGAQTVASIHRAVKIDRADIANVFVQGKITIVDPNNLDEMVPKISRFSNSQNQIKEADFSSNDPYHVAIERLSESLWVPGEQSRWFYERARGQYQVAKARESTTPARRKKFESKLPTSQKITKTDLAKYLNSWDQLPHKVSLGAQKNFVFFMSKLKELRGNDWEPDRGYYIHLVGKAILFKTIDRVAKKIMIPAWKAQTVTYTVAYLSHRTLGRINFDNIWNRQEITPGIEDTIWEWIPKIYDEIVESAGERNIGEWCKKEECWATIRGMNLDIPVSLKNEIDSEEPLPNVGPVDERKEETLSHEDRENIARVMKIDGITWLKIHGWGIQTGCLKEWQVGIAHTLSGYSSGGWKKVPSKRQAKCAVEILDIAKQESGIEIEM